jgi:GT2 family glycosyltransferase
VVLSYEPEAKHLTRCVASLRASTYRHIEVVLVDNGSRNGVCAQVAAQHPEVKFVPLPRNTGFSGGINRGVEGASGSLVFLVNPDAEVEPDTITTLVDAARRRPDAVGFAPKMLFSHDHDLIDSVGTAIDDMGAAFNRGIGQFDIGQYDWEEPVMGACFGAAMIRREAFLPHRVGMLDERFFLYYEDVDWCLRATLLGEHFWSVPAARVYHVHSATTRLQAYAFKYRLIERNLLRTVFRNFEKKRAVKVFVIRSLAHLRNIAFGRFKVASARALLEGWWSIALYWGDRTTQQRRRVASDGDAFKLNHGEFAFFDPVRYTPAYKWETLAVMLRRMWVMTADNRWQQATAYVESVSVSPLKFRPRIALERLESLAGPLPPQVLRFVEALERQPGMMVAKPAAGEPELESLLGPGEDARTA